MSADGHSTEAIRLVEIDGRGRSVLGTCAPIPGTGGKLLVVVFSQPLAGSEQAIPPHTQLYVWTPDSPNGTRGSAVSFYEEFSTDPEPIPNEAISAAVVGDRVWVPLAYRVGFLPTNPAGFSLQTIVLEVGAEQVGQGRPIRRVLAPGSHASYLDVTAQVIPAASDGAWLQVGRDAFVTVGWFHPTGTLVNTTGAFAFTRMLASNVGMNAMGMPIDEVALLYPDPNEDFNGNNYRVAWRSPFVVFARYGPVLPFRRFETPEPGSLRVGNFLYVMGNALGPTVMPAGIDGGVPDVAAADASDALSTDVAAGTAGPLVIYRVPWDADSAVAFAPVATIEPRVARSQVVSGNMASMPGSTTEAAITWVEFYPPDGAGHGARYVLFTKRQSLGPAM